MHSRAWLDIKDADKIYRWLCANTDLPYYEVEVRRSLCCAFNWKLVVFIFVLLICCALSIITFPILVLGELSDVLNGIVGLATVISSVLAAGAALPTREDEINVVSEYLGMISGILLALKSFSIHGLNLDSPTKITHSIVNHYTGKQEDLRKMIVVGPICDYHIVNDEKLKQLQCKSDEFCTLIRHISDLRALLIFYLYHELVVGVGLGVELRKLKLECYQAELQLRKLRNLTNSKKPSRQIISNHLISLSNLVRSLDGFRRFHRFVTKEDCEGKTVMSLLQSIEVVSV